MRGHNKRILAGLFACVLAISMIAPTAGAALTGETANADVQFQDEAAPIDSQLTDAEGTVEVMVRFGDVDAGAQNVDDVATLKERASESQLQLERMAQERDELTIRNQFWIANAALVEVDTNEVDLGEIARIEGVSELHPNFEVQIPDVEPSADANTTYGLDQIDAPEAWDEYGMGEGAKVAVLDTGMDVSHQDLELYTEDPDDPTYPGGWAEFDENGDQIEDSEPHDTGYHGTHTSGTIAGGDASGEHIGVAPGVDLMHGLVLPDGGTLAQVIGGMEWAVEEDADVISMSLGAPGYADQFIEPVQNAESMGTIVVAAAGNEGEGNSGSPGNVYDTMGIGASTEDESIASFSGGEEIDTEDAWEDAPEDWPDSYVVPDVAAPGSAVLSSIPGDSYDTLSGTSMATPHVAGAAALMVSATGDLEPEEISSTLQETAWKPDGEPEEPDVRYGNGIIDVKAATDEVAIDSGVVGTVTDADDEPVEGASVELAEASAAATTDENGTFELLVGPGEYTLVADGFGFDETSESVAVENDSFTSQDVTLEAAVDARLLEDQASGVQAGENVSAVLEAANLETLTVTADHDGAAANATLYVDGEMAEFGEPIAFDDHDGEVSVTVATDADDTGTFSLQHELSDGEDSVSLETGPTMVFEEYTTVGVVDDDEAFGAEVAEAIVANTPENYDVEVLTAGEALESDHDVYVVQQISGTNLEAFVDATQSADVGAVWLDQWGSGSNGVTELSSVTNDPATTDYDDGNGVPIYYEVESEHDIVADASVGDQIDLASPYWGDHSWFDETSYDVIASVGAPNTGTVAPALAVNDETSTVLASSLGRTTFVGNGDFTAAADDILVNAVDYAASDEESESPSGEFNLGESWAYPDSEGSVELNASADGVAGYQATIEFDADVIEVTGVEGEEFDDPVVNVDNDAGTVSVAQAQATGVDAPTLASIEFETVAEDGVETELSFVGEDTMLNDEQGETIVTSLNDGSVSVLACTPGDANSDGEVTAADATLSQRYIAGHPIDGEFEPNCADVNDDGMVTAADVTIMLQEAVGLEA